MHVFTLVDSVSLAIRGEDNRPHGEGALALARRRHEHIYGEGRVAREGERDFGIDPWSSGQEGAKRIIFCGERVRVVTNR